MQTYYSVISAAIRPEIQEKVSIGLLFVTEGKLWLHFSKDKLKITRKLLPGELYKGLQNSIGNIQKAAFLNVEERGHFFSTSFDPKLFGNQYLDYLSRYRQNIISFSGPSPIALEPTEANFRTLFIRFVDEFTQEEEQVSKKRAFQAIKKKPVIRKHFDIDLEIDQQLVPGLFAPMKVGLAGQNEQRVFVQTVDMSRRYDHISDDVNAFALLSKVAKNAKKMLVAWEPPQKELKQHLIWERLKEAKEFEYIDIKDIQILEEFAESHDVKPLSEVVGEVAKKEDRV